MTEAIKQPLTAENLKSIDKIISQLIKLRSSMRDKNNCTIEVGSAITKLCVLVGEHSQTLKLTAAQEEKDAKFSKFIASDGGVL